MVRDQILIKSFCECDLSVNRNSLRLLRYSGSSSIIMVGRQKSQTKTNIMLKSSPCHAESSDGICFTESVHVTIPSPFGSDSACAHSSAVMAPQRDQTATYCILLVHIAVRFWMIVGMAALKIKIRLKKKKALSWALTLAVWAVRPCWICDTKCVASDVVFVGILCFVHSLIHSFKYLSVKKPKLT